MISAADETRKGCPTEWHDQVGGHYVAFWYILWYYVQYIVYKQKEGPIWLSMKVLPIPGRMPLL